jgi:hypothetical protein
MTSSFIVLQIIVPDLCEMKENKTKLFWKITTLAVSSAQIRHKVTLKDCGAAGSE